MDIFNRPPTIAEDTLQYTLHPGPEFPDKSAVTTLATVIDSHVSSILPSHHIWHRDAFEVKLISQAYGKDRWNIEGRMRVGDCIDDEWCVVWLLRNISQHWDVAVSVFDSDGEFLLIEAADYLPSWVTPTNSENRVWIYQGRLHLVPLQHVSPATAMHVRRRLPGGSANDDEDADDPESGVYISFSDAVQLVRKSEVDTLAPPEVENAAFRRIKGYPALVHQHLHRTRAHLPKDIALALLNHQALVQKASEAFYTRDAMQLRAATRMARFAPDTAVLTTLTMTRTAYAQLVGQKFHPPKVFGQWKEKEGTREWRWRDIGMKIACGFEMLYQESKGRHELSTNGVDGSGASVEARKEALRRDPEYIQYIQNLQSIGYFKGEASGSASWRMQENRASAQFINARQVDNANRPPFASLVNIALSQAQLHSDNQPGIVSEEDSDEWLTVNEETIDGILAQSLRPKMPVTVPTDEMDVDTKDPRGESEDKLVTEQAGQLRDLAEKVEKFVEGQGDVEGATFEELVTTVYFRSAADDNFFYTNSDVLSEGSLSEMSDFSDENASSWTNETKGAVTAERQTAMDKLVPALEPSEYGKMPPSFYSNSQKTKKVTVESAMTTIEEQEALPPPKPMRPLIFPRDQFDGVEDSDDESEEEGADEGEVDGDEDRPTVIGEVEVDMQEEEEDFLKFSREALGISPDMWSEIIRDRKGRGAFVPPSALREEFGGDTEDGHMSSLSGSTAAPRQRQPDSGPRPNANLHLDSFEAVMQAMDAELSRVKQEGANPIHSRPLPKDRPDPKGKGKQRAEEDDEDSETTMDAELGAALQASDDEGDEGGETSMDYTLIKNFLESFKSQNGLSGPVGNLVGRLQPGWKLPRDES